MRDMSTTTFQIIYDGPALASHEMEVRDLAPALLALGDLFEQANHTLNGSRAKVSISVKGSFKTGCFAIDVVCAQSLLQQAKDMFAGEAITAALNLVQVVGLSAGAGGGVLALIKWVAGRKVTLVELADNGKAKVYCDKDAYETEQQVIDLFSNWKLRKAFQDVIHKPLQQDGIEYFAVRDGSNDFVSVSRNQSNAFIAPEEVPEDLEESEREQSLQIVSVTFKDDNKWRFYDGSATFHAAILDDDFLNRVDLSEESFAKGDILKVLLREKKTLVGGGLRSEVSVLKVIEHRRASTQLRLPIQTK